MYLKRLKVRNFKSFAGSTEIPFQPGFTGVAGPNGMGKSNISDAILFVLGPTSSKALRADRLTHLFFNGGASKKAATECEVSLQFDNRDRLIPVESDEVEVTRYVKLAPNDSNGYYSYFYVNGRRSTQTEIDSLLSHARLSGDGYNLVQQGDVNRIVSMGPIPRRALVERLAGISQYDEELQRADSKRADLETNLMRIGTLLTEIRGHLQSLESQRLQAIQYKTIQDEKRKAEAQLARAGHRLARQEVQSCEAQLLKVSAEIEKLREEATRLTDQQTATAQKIEAVEKEIARRGGPEAAKFKDELDQRRMAFARLDENVRQAGEEVAQLETRFAALTTQIKTDEKEAARLQSAEGQLAQQLRVVEQKVLEQTKALAAATGEAEQSQGKLVGTRRQVLQLERQQEEKRQGWAGAVQSLESAKALLASAERDEAQAEDDHRARELEAQDLELRARPGKDRAAKETSTPELQKEFFAVKAKEKTLTAEGERLGQEVLELNRRFMSLDARLKVRTEGGARANPMAAVDFLLSQRNLGRIPGIRGTVEELARFEPQHQTALAVSAGNRFQALVVETDQVAEECIKLLRAEKRGRATFLPLNRMLPGRPRGKSLIASQSPGAVGFAIDLVKFDEELRPAFWYVFGETVVMEDLGHARSQMGGVRLVTLTGDLIEATGAMSGGYLETGEKGRGADNAVELKRLGEELRAKSTAESDARAELQRLGERARTLGEELARRSAQAEAHDSASKILEKELGTARERVKEAMRRIETARQVHAKAQVTLKSAEADSARFAHDLDEIKSSLGKLQEEYLGHLPGAVSTKIRTLQESAQAGGEERLRLTRELEAARASSQAATQALSARHAEFAQAKSAHEQKKKEGAALARSRDEAKSALEALRGVETQQLQAVQAQTEERSKLDSARLKIVDLLARAQETLRTRISMQQQEEVRLATARQHLSEVEAALKELPEDPVDAKPVPVEELKRTIATLASQLESMGSVNLLALEEYDQEKHRLEEFDGEANRLGSEKTELLSLVAEIEGKKKVKLKEVVVSVNDGFREIYGELSAGGEGEIGLENPDDPLAGGLLIKARPVGKNVQRLEQLSGGEKSLASLAFIFALQRYDPSPLYVFDEVDMSLDGVNAENVGRMLRRNSERAQFIVISLRKVTLKFARQLFGVTMHGDGCSRVVGLRLDEIVDVDDRERATEASTAIPTEAA
ncbi:MAG: chromosome segregation protein SMC [Thermoplasmata archaeon]|nr:chromosome segregation protein SMC [Thermoplasmata archaeon]